MADAGKPGRPNQRSRTRKDILDAAARLMKEGRRPSLEEVAEEALVSRATTYRYFPGLDALLVEASLHVALPEANELFGSEASADPLKRLEQLEEAMSAMMAANEAPLRMMLVHSLQRRLSESAAEPPARQNRRTPLIEAALDPARDQFRPETLERLSKALALVLGTEAMVVFKDVLQVDDAEARDITRWAIRALLEAAKTERREG